MNKSNQKAKTGDKVVDEIGEVIMELYEGDRVVRKEQDEYTAQHIIDFNKKVPFVKVYLSECDELYEDLTGTEFMIINHLINYISYNDNILRIGKKPMKIKDIAEVTKKDYDNMRKTMTSLEKKGVVKKIKWMDEECSKEMNCIAVNPFLFFRGKDIRKDVVALFRDSKWSNLKYKSG